MTIIYEPSGKAREYAALAANLYRGCSHGCIYCYAPSATFKDRELFHSKTFCSPRKNCLDKLKIDALSIEGSKDNVLLSFTTDPYQKINNVYGYTREAIKILNSCDIGVTILTKGGINAERDFDLLKLNPINKFGVTLTCIDPVESCLWEPSAAPPQERISSLKRAHELGISTYVSFEPVVSPGAVYELIETTKCYVDFYKVGRLNYHPHSKNINWPDFRNTVISVLNKNNKPFLIKKDLLNAF